MCGIFGVCYWDQTPIDQSHVIRARDQLLHRGPDDAGIYISHNVALAHRRLSIIDLSPLGRQPMCNEDQTVWITFNGEIYNFLELREELLARGHHFKSHTDTEVIVHAYEEWGTACFARIDGMFALGIWDAKRDRMILGRDRRGKKPLFYHHAEGQRLVFSSTLAPLLQWHDVPRDLNTRGIHEYIKFGFFGGASSILSEVQKLPPGHFASFDRQGAQTTQYWNLIEVARRPKLSFSSEQECLDQLDAVLRAAVKRRLVSDVPVGAFLSGGVDSSLMVALIKAVSGQAIKTFTIGFGDSALDESAAAQQVAQHLGVPNKTVRMSGNEMLRYLPDVTKLYDEPILDFSLFPTMAVSELARSEVTVVLSGDGGDELFAGYDRYRAMAHFQRYFAGLGLPVREFLAKRVAPKVPNERFRRFLKLLAARDTAAFCGSYSNVLRYYDLEQVFPEEAVEQLSKDTAGGFVRDLDRMDPIEAAMLYDLTHGMIDGILVKVDRATMAFGVEGRCPLIDTAVTEFALQIPWRLKSNGPELKPLLKKLLCRYLPKELVYRKKMGFTPPMAEWLRNELREQLTDALAPETIRRRGLFRPEGIGRLVDQHMRREFDHSYLLWELLMLEMWTRHYVDQH